MFLCFRTRRLVCLPLRQTQSFASLGAASSPTRFATGTVAPCLLASDLWIARGSRLSRLEFSREGDLSFALRVAICRCFSLSRQLENFDSSESGRRHPGTWAPAFRRRSCASTTCMAHGMPRTGFINARSPAVCQAHPSKPSKRYFGGSQACGCVRSGRGQWQWTGSSQCWFVPVVQLDQPRLSVFEALA